MPPLHCTYAMGMFDSDPAAKTSACNPDSDSDGIQDGAEDANQNGRVDAHELDPNAAGDGMGPASQACAITNLKKIDFHLSSHSDVQVALRPEFAEVVKLTDASGERGVIFYDATHQVAGLAIDDPRSPPPASATAEETYARGKLGQAGAITAPLQPDVHDLGRLHAERAQLVRSGRQRRPEGAHQRFSRRCSASRASCPGTAGAAGPFKIQAQYVRRAASRSIILIAITPAAGFAGERLFTLADVGGGSALAQFGDYARRHLRGVRLDDQRQGRLSLGRRQLGVDGHLAGCGRQRGQRVRRQARRGRPRLARRRRHHRRQHAAVHERHRDDEALVHHG